LPEEHDAAKRIIIGKKPEPKIGLLFYLLHRNNTILTEGKEPATQRR
jgi:hypothetical protein